MNGFRYLAVAATVVALAIAGCGGGGSSDSPAPGPGPEPELPPPGVQAAFENLSFSRPVALLQAPGDDTRWFVVEKAGIVRVFDNEPAVSTSTVFADLSSQVESTPGEAGLLGMAFHPDFANNRVVFLSFTAPGPPDGGPLVSRIDQFTATDNGAMLDTTTQTPVLSINQPFANHNGGHLAFGPDGLLYAGFGDGGSAGDPNGNAQTTSNLLGTIIRIDIDGAVPYAIPPDNPFAGNPRCATGTGSAACPEIFAYGFRNPWRFSFDRVTGELYAGDVGQNSFEEIDRVTSGGNYGWNIREGANCYPPTVTNCATAGLIDPIHEYDRDAGRSVTGGYVYRGTAIPSLVSRYVFGDFVTGRIWSIDAQAQSLVASEELAATPLAIASFAEDSAGEIYVVNFSGSLHRLVAE